MNLSTESTTNGSTNSTTKGRASEPSQTPLPSYKGIKHTKKESTTMIMKVEGKKGEKDQSSMKGIYQNHIMFCTTKSGIFFYGIKQHSRKIYLYFIKIHQNIPGYFFLCPCIQEQSQPLGRHRSQHQGATEVEYIVLVLAPCSLLVREFIFPI